MNWFDRASTEFVRNPQMLPWGQQSQQRWCPPIQVRGPVGPRISGRAVLSVGTGCGGEVQPVLKLKPCAPQLCLQRNGVPGVAQCLQTRTPAVGLVCSRAVKMPKLTVFPSSRLMVSSYSDTV